MANLSIIIPARNEMFLAKTVENILQNIEGDTEVIAVMDGDWANPGIPDDPRVTVLHYSQSIGQRAATNRGVALSKAKYIMKADAHCAFDKGFDVKMIAEMHDDWTMVPTMKNLHAFDWMCPDGHRRYQGPSGLCSICGKKTKRDVMWEAKPSPNSTSYCFDSTPHFQYFREYSKRPEAQGEITETMSLQGSCFMLTRNKYWELDVCDEAFGSWGSQGIEVAVKTWLSGGRVMVNKKTWYAHMFRTQGGDFGFPYPIRGSDQEKAKSFARDLFFNNKWPLQKRPLSWLIEKFWPVPGWTEEDLDKLKNNTFYFEEKKSEHSFEEEPKESLTQVQTPEVRDAIPEIKLSEGIIYDSCLSQKYEQIYTKGILFYTDHALNIKEAKNVQRNLVRISNEKGIPIVSVSIKPMPDFGTNICLPDLKDDPKKDIKQILEGLKNFHADYVYICKNNIIYNPEYFDTNPAFENNEYTHGRREYLIKYYSGLLKETVTKK